MTASLASGWEQLEALQDDGTFSVLRRATPRAWADLFAACPELAGTLREIADFLDDQEAA